MCRAVMCSRDGTRKLAPISGIPSFESSITYLSRLMWEWDESGCVGEKGCMCGGEGHRDVYEGGKYVCVGGVSGGVQN